jgi:Ca2+/H+ antiporter, TMEM165/GDT1 family|tara:strand:- start:10910 stop:11293 length:384 start_codon:yes stop_codon:yes gene_type:complete
MNAEKVVFSFFIVLALTLNFGFFLGELDDFTHHNIYELFATIVVNLIAMGLKLGDRTQVGAVLLSTSLVANLQLIAAALVWGYASNISGDGLNADNTAIIVSLSGGALVANVISVVILVSETLMSRR